MYYYGAIKFFVRSNLITKKMYTNIDHLMLQAGSLIMCGFATDGMQTVMVGSVEVEQVNSCAALLDLTLRNIETTQTIAVVDAECHGDSLFLPMHPIGSEMYSFATCGIQTATVVSVVAALEGNSVLVPTTGPPTTETILTAEEVAVGWLGNCEFRCMNTSD